MPVFKKSDCKLVRNYRPISVLIFLDNVLEKLAEIHLRIYFRKFYILTKCQFRISVRGLSTNIATANFTDIIKIFIDNRTYATMIIVNFARAFDSIDRNILIKLECCGIPGPHSNLLWSLMNKRKHFCKRCKLGSNYYKIWCSSRLYLWPDSLLNLR